MTVLKNVELFTRKRKVSYLTTLSVTKHDGNSVVDIVTRYGWTTWGSNLSARGVGVGRRYIYI